MFIKTTCDVWDLTMHDPGVAFEIGAIVEVSAVREKDEYWVVKYKGDSFYIPFDEAEVAPLARRFRDLVEGETFSLDGVWGAYRKTAEVRSARGVLISNAVHEATLEPDRFAGSTIVEVKQ